MKIAIINTNLNPKSKSVLLSQAIETVFKETQCETDFINLSEIELPFCDGGSCYKDPRVIDVTGRVEQCDGVIISSPIYNYDLNAVAKNFLELTNSAWSNKIVGFICQAGGEKSYMSVMAFANSLTLDHRCQVLPRFVYATGKDFVDNQLEAEGEVALRLKRMASEMLELHSA